MAQGQGQLPVTTPAGPTVAGRSVTTTRRRRAFETNLRDLPYALLFVGPALLLIGFLIVYPTLRTIYNSMTQTAGIGFSAPQQWVGLDNYNTLITDPVIHTAVINNLLWLIVITPVTVVLGVVFAVLFDKVRYEPVAKSIVFIPMAISATAAGVIWRLVYADDPNTGTINAVLGWFHVQPVPFLGRADLANFALFTAQVWLGLGFAVVVLSAALKSIPADLTEAARIDGASTLRIFYRITVPMMWPTITVIITLTMIGVLKIFDVIWTMTSGGPAGATEVLATRMYTEAFKNFNPGYGSAIAVVLLIAVLPIMAINIQRFRTEGPR